MSLEHILTGHQSFTKILMMVDAASWLWSMSSLEGGLNTVCLSQHRLYPGASLRFSCQDRTTLVWRGSYGGCPLHTLPTSTHGLEEGPTSPPSLTPDLGKVGWGDLVVFHGSEARVLDMLAHVNNTQPARPSHTQRFLFPVPHMAQKCESMAA